MCAKTNNQLLLESVHHVAIICSDYQRSKTFYTQLLGFSVIRETYRADRDSYKLVLKINENTQIELFSFPNAPKRPSYPEAQGLRHLAFATRNLDENVKYLRGQNVVVEDVRLDELTGKRFTFFADPDGLPLELYEQ